MQDETILNKMRQEITHAEESLEDRDTFLQHIQHIKLLTELFLEDKKETKKQPQQTTNPSFSEQEIKAMLGETKAKEYKPKQKPTTKLNHDGANGESIFDF
jgi:hypothetical protein